MKVTAISGFGAKGPASFLVETRGRRLLLDLGEGPEPGARPQVHGLGKVDAILLSHAHNDHVGALDLVPRLGRPDIWCTPLVGELAEAERFGALRPLPYSGETEVLGLPVMTGPAGHAPGAIWMRIGGEEGLLYTGDMSTEGLLYCAEALPRAAGLICDASYGEHDLPLEDGIAEVTAAAGVGPLLLPAPPGGRGLEMAVVLHERGLRVALCRQHRGIAARLVAEPALLGAAATRRLAAALAAALPLAGDSPPAGAMIAADADADGGTAGVLARRWSSDPAIGIVFTGHLASGTAAEALVREGAARFIRWNVHPRLRDLRAVLEATGAVRIMPAFLPRQRIGAVAEMLWLGDRLAGPSFELGAG